MIDEGKIGIRSIVLADDDSDDIEIFKDSLNEVQSDIQLESVSNGKQLMELISHFLPDLLFIDLDMPVKNGLECLVEIRSNPKMEELPVIVFSSTTRPANIQTAYEMGAHLFLIKSSSYEEYKSALKAILTMDWSSPSIIREQYCVNGRYTAFS
jgi:CheY-like chemotaxis protein